MLDPHRQLTIGDVARRAGVATSALRFYEDQGLITSTRNDAGHRRYHGDVLRRVSFIRVAQKVGLSLAEIAAALDSLPSGRAPTRSEWHDLSTSWQGRLDEQMRLLVNLRDRLDGCIGCGCLSLDVCALFNADDKAAATGTGPRYLLGDPPKQ